MHVSVLPDALLRWWRSTMLTCLALVTETLLYCRPSLALFAVAHDLNVEIELDSGYDSRTQSACALSNSFLVAERKLKWQANHE